MRRGLLVGTLALLAAWFLVKAVPFLTEGRPAVWATPTSRPFSAQQLFPVAVPAGRRACVTGMPWGPQARYVQLEVLPGVRNRTPPLTVEASGPGYRASGAIAGGLKQNAKGVARIAAAPRELTGSVCVLNRGTRPLELFGVSTQGRQVAPVRMTVAGRDVKDRQLSITLLSNPDQSLIARMGDVLGHVAGFRPVGTWVVWILLLLLLLATPAGVALALSRAGAMDDDDQEPSARS
jgi:hypothetical protein